MISLLYPVPPNSRVTQTFQDHVDWANAHPGIPYNGGIDWAVIDGTPILATADGVVVEIQSTVGGYGTNIRLQHEQNVLSIYAHLRKPVDGGVVVRLGDIVRAGQIVGYSNNTGNSTGPHLHFEVRENGTPIDPMPYLIVEVPGPDPEIPEVPTAIITVNGLRVRNKPSINSSVVGYLNLNKEVPVIEISYSGSDKWLRIGYDHWCAMQYSGQVYARWK